METNDMRVLKRDGQLETVAFDKILNRIRKLGIEAQIQINYTQLAIKVIDQLYDEIPTAKIDELAAEQCAAMATLHPDYGTLASRIIVSNHQKNTSSNFCEVVDGLYNYVNVLGENKPLLAKTFWDFTNLFADQLNGMIDYNRDYLIDYFGFKTLERAYLFKNGDKTVERPQHMWLRVAIGIHAFTDGLSHETVLQLIKETYDLMSLKFFTHATPTLFNAGTPKPQLSSCYLIAMEDDSIDGIFNTLKDCARISKWAGGIGLHIHNIRAKGTHIQGTNGISNGIVPMLRVFNNTARYVDQGGNKRNGSFAVYLEPWHADIYDFLELKKNHGDEELKARDLFYALWIPDLFMERVKEPNGKWSLFCPHECSGLSDVVGKTFVDLYKKYEDEGKAFKTVLARDLWFKILDAQMETGTPYLLYKDAANKKSNQQNLGTIKSSNLCVVYDTYILTDKGYLCIGELEGQQVNVWNGYEYSLVTVKKTGTNQPIMKVTCGINGDKDMVLRLECTPQHKFYITVEEDVIGEFNHWQKVTYVKQIDAKDLKLGMRLIGCTMPTTEGSRSFTEGCRSFTEGCSSFTEGSYDFMSVVALEDYGKTADTFCFTEPKRHMGVFNGILTGQCTEIIEYSNENETAVCNLASIALPSFVNAATKEFDYDNLHKITKTVTYNLNRVIDINFYPTEKTKLSNLRHRPIGIGVQGLADVYMLMDISFHSDKAKEINKLIFETIYHAALTKSNELAVERKQQYQRLINLHKMSMLIGKEIFLPENVIGAYSSFAGSPASEGILQFDMWNVTPTDRYDWTQLKKSIVENGLRNSLLVAPMPTASTSQILGFNECFEPFTSNIYTRRTLAGEFVIVNKYLMRELIDLGLWNEQIKNNIVLNKGSVQQLTMLSEHLRNKYKTVWEIPMRHIIDMSADRGAYICQSQSLNLWMEDPVYNKLTSMHFYAWEKGLKTGIYYLRRKAKHNAQQFTIEPESKNTKNSESICEMCSA